MHSYIQGFSGRGYLLYLHDERNLFIKNKTTNSADYYQCYHVLLKNEPGYIPCPVTCIVNGSNCRRNSAEHSHQTDHKVQFRDMQSINAMKETCRWLHEHCPSSASKIPLHDIFLLEISK